MSSEQTTFKHILVAFDASPHSRAALATAAELAAELGAELIGLFVEDTDLLHSASLPFVRQINPFASIATDVRQMECQFRVQAGQMQRDLASIAQRFQVPWSCQITRGQVGTEVAAAAGSTDLLILGRSGWRSQRVGALGSTVRRLMTRAPRATLMLQREELCLPMPLVVAYDSSTCGDQALSIAAAMAQIKNGALEVLLVATTEDQQRTLLKRAQTRLGPERSALHYRPIRLQSDRVAPLAHHLNLSGAGTLILPCDLLGMNPTQLQTLLGQIAAPILLVGPTDTAS